MNMSFKNPLTKKVTKVGRLYEDEFIQTSAGKSSGGKYAEKCSPTKLTFKQMRDIYLVDPWIRAIVDKIVDRASSIQDVIKPVNSEDVKEEGKAKDEIMKLKEKISEILNNCNDNFEDITDIKKKTFLDLTLLDAGPVEIVKDINLLNSKTSGIQLYSVPGDTIKISANKKGLLKGNAFKQVLPNEDMKVVANWSIEEMMYLMLRPTSGKLYGTSPLESLVNTVNANLYASQYNSNFFMNNATPRLAVMMEKVGIGQASPSIKRFREFWDKELRGLKNAHRPIIMSSEQGSTKIEKMSMTNDEMQFYQYSVWLLVQMMAVFKMQPGIMGLTMDKTSYNKDAIKEQERIFKTEAINPMLSIFRNKFNQKVIFSEYGLNTRKVYVDYDLDLVDRKEQTDWQTKLLERGVFVINDVRGALGLEPVPWGDVPYLQNNVAPFGVGPNGPVLPLPGTEDNQTTDNNVPNVTTASKSNIIRYISKNNPIYPIGWEDLEISERVEVIKSLLKINEQNISKFYQIPKMIGRKDG